MSGVRSSEAKGGKAWEREEREKVWEGVLLAYRYEQG